MKSDQIIITNPCEKDWNSMQVTNKGKFCGSCNKTVIDFSTWEVEEIKEYLKNKNQRVCGHFNALQVAVKRPKHHQYLVNLYLKTDSSFRIPVIKSVALSFIVLCMSAVGCNRPTTGEIVIPRDEDTVKVDSNLIKDSLKAEQQLMGDTILLGEISRVPSKNQKNK